MHSDDQERANPGHPLWIGQQESRYRKSRDRLMTSSVVEDDQKGADPSNRPEDQRRLI
jgi:hypothetical protein